MVNNRDSLPTVASSEPHHLGQVQRHLKQRHVQMIAISGTIGTGLFLGSGEALQRAGPLGALLAYIHVGTIVYATIASVGEMTSFAPIPGTFPHYAARFVDPALGFAVGWIYLYANLLTIPVEIVAAGIILSFWDTDVDSPRRHVYTAIIVVMCTGINVFGVRWFGESEFFFGTVKICLIIALILAGLVINLGGGPDHVRTGFTYWDKPGAMNNASDLVEDVPLGRFLALLSVLVQASFSFGGIELVAIAASETESPRRNIAKAVRRVFYRILIFYILGILVTGMLVPYNDKRLITLKTGNAAQSPYVIAIQNASINVLPDVINAGVLTSAFSAGNSYVYCSSRILYGLALRGQAPAIFARCTKNGLPLIAVLVCASFGLLSFLSFVADAKDVFKWLVNLALGILFAWWTINLTYLFFYRGLEVQGIDRMRLVYWSALQPRLAIWGVFWCTAIILICGFDVFFHFTPSGFLTAYITIPLFLSLLIGYRVIKKTEFWKPEAIDFVNGIPTLAETELPERPPRHIWERIFNTIF